MEDQITKRWRVSSFSGNGGGTCVEVAQASDGTILVRDSKDRSNAPHRYTSAEWRAFVAGVRNGEFDLDDSGCLS
ncbi:MAG TPA: DUF397 domain-containing protein [Streptosporangiaceae bacterium]|nr:DUF397 domain-containing protein [Streptosporangiaceae bacterium]